MSALVWNGDQITWNGDPLIFTSGPSLPVFPPSIVETVDRRLMSASVAVTSPFTGTQSVQDWGGRWWEYQIRVMARQGLQGRALSAFTAKLGGQIEPFLFDDPSIRQTGNYGTPTVNGAGQTGNTLITDGWGSVGLLAGDFFSLGTDSDTRLYQLKEDVVPVGGSATLEFVPALRSSPADNAVLEVNAPKVLLRATSPIVTGIQPGDVYSFNFSAREAI